MPTVLRQPTAIIVSRAAAGVGAAFIMPATLSLLTRHIPKSERNKAVGIWAGVAAPAQLSESWEPVSCCIFWSWQSIFWAFTVAAAALVPILHLHHRDVHGTKPPTPVDWLGAVVIGSAVAAFVFGMRRGAGARVDHPLCLISACRGHRAGGAVRD